jgi:hypothetical protein
MDTAGAFFFDGLIATGGDCIIASGALDELGAAGCAASAAGLEGATDGAGAGAGAVTESAILAVVRVDGRCRNAIHPTTTMEKRPAAPASAMSGPRDSLRAKRRLDVEMA